jgi:hypothetical protein
VKLGHFIAFGFAVGAERGAITKLDICFRHGWQFGVATPFEV